MARRDLEVGDTISVEEASASGVGSLEPSTRASTLSPGELIADRYRVEAALGEGGMGAVYRVRDEKLDDVVALKLLTLESEKAVERFVREVRLARKVTHPNVARTHDFGEARGLRFLTMELVDGDTLDALIESEGPQSPERAVELAEQIAQGLEAAHAAGVIHRDLKPANVMLTSTGRVVLTDFGIARAAESDGKKTNDLVGTPLYMSPEQVSGRPLDARSDVYALGLILYELMVGDLPFAGDTPIAIAIARLGQPPPDPRAQADVPDELAELVRACLALDPESRPRSAAALGEALARWRESRVDGTRSASAASTLAGRPRAPSLYAPLAVGRALAVLPFSFRGTAEHDYLGEGLAEELVDVLSRTRGLRVIALGATRRFAEDRDPARVRAELGADVVVDGTVQVSARRVRITARLLDTEAGIQRWTQRFDGCLEDVFTFQEQMGRRVAEALRLEVDAASYGRQVPEEAVQLYLGARRQLRIDSLGRAPAALELLGRCIDVAPEFAPALAAHAMASVRAWWAASVTFDDPGLGAAAVDSVTRAVELAPDVAETHLARAMLAAQVADFGTTAEALAKALDIAPTFAEANQYLGDLQLEAGRPEEGTRRLRLALQLDPTQYISELALARRQAMFGDVGPALAIYDRLEAEIGLTNLAVLSSRIRLAVYQRDLEKVRALHSRLATAKGAGLPMASQLSLLLERPDPAAVDARRREIMGRIGNQRFRSLVGQVSVEIYTAAGHHDLAMGVLDEIAELALIDIDWLERLALLAPLRERPDFEGIADKVRERASAIWRRT